MVGLLGLLAAVSAPAGSPLRSPDGQLAVNTAPLMRSIVPLIFLLFLIPSIVYGLIAGTVRSSRDVIVGMERCSKVTIVMTMIGSYLPLLEDSAGCFSFFLQRRVAA